MKTCPRCGQERPAEAFHKRSRSADGLALWCKSCVSAYGRARYAANPDPIVERAKAWAAVNRSRRAEISRRWYAGNREAAARAVKRWTEANRSRVRATKLTNQQQRRARKMGARREAWTTPDILERDGWECRMPRCICPAGRAIDPEARDRWRGTADHVIPLARGGDDAPDNLRAAHGACNAAKNSALDDEPRGA